MSEEKDDDDDTEETEEVQKDEEEEAEEGDEEFDFMPSLAATNCEESGKEQQACGLRRRNVPE